MTACCPDRSAAPLGDLATGSRFQSDGTVSLNAAPTSALWHSLGDRIGIRHRDGASETHPWSRVDAALRGDAG